MTVVPIGIGAASPWLASIVSAVPDGTSDRRDVTQWLRRGLAYSDGAVDHDTFAAFMAGSSWVQVTGATRFWGDNIARLTDAAAAIGAGLALLGFPVAVSATSRSGVLSLRLGAPAHLDSIVRLVCAGYQDLELRSAAPPSEPFAERTSVAARRNPDADPESSALLDRVGALPEIDWQVDVVLVPVPRPTLDARLGALTDLGRVMAHTRSAQVQTDPVTTRHIEDPEAVRLLDAVAEEIDQCGSMLDRGALAVTTRISAPDRSALAAVSGAVISGGHNGSARWRIADPGAPMPVGLLDSVATSDVLRLPARDLTGLPSRRHHELDEHTEPPEPDRATLHLGRGARGAPIKVPTEILSRHVFCSGQTGSGKTSFLAHLARQLDDQGIPVTVLEPVKDEYAGLTLENLRVWRPGAADPGQPWALNPLVVPRGVSVAQHADRLVALLRGSLGLPDPLPALLQIAVSRVYRDAGWDLAADANVFGRAAPPWPDLAMLRDTALELEIVDGYDRQTRGTIRSALAARFEGLLTGPRARVLLGSTDLPIDEVLGAPLVVNLDAVGDPYVRAFIAQAFLIRLVEHRRAHPSPRLAHVTVIEEAHTLMPAGRPTPATGSADPIGDVAAALGDLLAEIRSTGEGLVIADQSPSRLDRSAIVNTATKICLRTAERADQEVLAASVGLDPEATAVFAGLTNHEAVVAWEGMDAPVRVGLVARHLVAREAPRATSAPQFTLVPEETARLASLLLAVPEADAAPAWRALIRSIRTAYPGIDEIIVREIIEAALRTAVTDLGRRRRWSTATCEAVTDALLAHRDHDAALQPLMEAGPRPFAACATACPDRTCRFREIIAPAAERATSAGNGVVLRMLADEDERHRRLARRVRDVVPPEYADGSDVVTRATRCLAVQVFDRDFDEPTVTAIVRRIGTTS